MIPRMICASMIVWAAVLLGTAKPDRSGPVDAEFIWGISQMVTGGILLAVGIGSTAIVMAIGNTKRE